MTKKSSFSRVFLVMYACATLTFLLVPVLIVVPMSFSSASTLAFPPRGFSLRWFESLLSDPAWTEAFFTSLTIAAISATAATFLAGLSMYGLERGMSRWRTAAESNLMAPLIVPGIVTAIALYFSFAQFLLLGTYTGIVIAHTILAVPFVMMVLGTALRSLDIRLEQVAWSLGASWSQTAVRVLLPNLAPSLLASWIFAFVISFDEVIVTSFIAGPIHTVPKKMYNELLLGVTPTITAVATLLIIATLCVMAVAQKLRKSGEVLQS